MKLKLISAIFLFCAITVPVSAQQPVSVENSFGQFIFEASVVSERYLGQKLKGKIINDTSKDWMDLTFQLTYFDANGNKADVMSGNDIRITELKKGASYSIGYDYGERIFFRGVKEIPIVRYEVMFKGGTLPATYSFQLVNKLKTKSGKIELAASNDLQFNDDQANFIFSVSKQQLGFVLRNKTDDPIEIDWNKVAFVDVGGESHKVMHSGVKYIARNEPLAPTTVPPSAKLEDFVLPSDYVYFSEGSYGGWRELPLFPEGDKAVALKGQTFTLFLPLRINGAVKNYTFRFKIADVTL